MFVRSGRLVTGKFKFDLCCIRAMIAHNSRFWTGKYFCSVKWRFATTHTLIFTFENQAKLKLVFGRCWIDYIAELIWHLKLLALCQLSLSVYILLTFLINLLSSTSFTALKKGRKWFQPIRVLLSSVDILSMPWWPHWHDKLGVLGTACLIEANNGRVFLPALFVRVSFAN